MKGLRKKLEGMILLLGLLFTYQHASCDPDDWIIFSAKIFDTLNLKEIQISYRDTLSEDTIKHRISLDRDEYTVVWQCISSAGDDMSEVDIYSYSKDFTSLNSIESRIGYQTYSAETYSLVEDEIKNMYLIYIDEWPVAPRYSPDNVTPVDRIIGLNKGGERYSFNWDSYLFDINGGETKKISWEKSWWGMTVDLNPNDGIKSNIDLSETSYELKFISENNNQLSLNEVISQLQNLGFDCEKWASMLMIEFGLHHRFVATLK